MAGVEVKGLKQFRRDLKAADAKYPKELRALHKRIADRVSVDARKKAQSLGGVHAKAAAAIKPRATQTEARLSVVPQKRTAMANVAFFGARARTGWYSHYRYASSARTSLARRVTGRVRGVQHPGWVGNSWEIAKRGEGPYALNDAIRTNVKWAQSELLDGMDKLAARAFPEGR